MADPASGSYEADPLVASCAVVLMAANLLRDHWEDLSDEDRVAVLDRLLRRAGEASAGAQALIRTGRGDQDRIGELESTAEANRDHIEALEVAALNAEAAALVSDARIFELAAEVDRLLAAQGEAIVIDQAKRTLMEMLDISEDAAFAVLVAASQRDDVSLHTIAHRVMTSQDRRP
jgi:hypothetical protein